MTRVFREVLSLLVVVVLAATAWGQKAGTAVSEADAASCAALFVTAPSESPQILDLCHGVAALDYAGEVWVKLPKGFNSRTGNLRYQLTAIWKPSPNLHVDNEVSGDRFHIAGGRRRQKVSWQVIGLRTVLNTSVWQTGPRNNSELLSSAR